MSTSPQSAAERPGAFLGGFRRITSSINYIPEIDGIRFFAILAVFLFHVAGDILRHSPSGYSDRLQGNPVFWTTQVLNIGVQMFFVLSGYVLALPFASYYRGRGKAVSLKRYLLRRLTRLEPPYIVALVLFFFLKLGSHHGSFANLLPHLGASVGYVHNLLYAKPSEIDFVAWSLEIEVQFYLLAPLLCLIFLRSGSVWTRRVSLAVCCLAWGGAASFFAGSPRVELSLLGQMPYFLAGLLLADTATSAKSAKAAVSSESKRTALWDLVTVLLVAFLFFSIRVGWLLPYAGALTIAAAYWSAFRSGMVLRILRTAIVSTIGGMCYSIYLLHNYVIAIGGALTERLGAGAPFYVRLLVQAGLLGLLVLLVSAIFFALIERPCMRADWPQRLTRWARECIGGKAVENQRRRLPEVIAEETN